MDERTGAELRSLSARAYGPGEGLDGDPEALGRLRALERLAAVERAGATEVVAKPEDPPEAFADSIPRRPATTQDDDPADAAAVPARLWWTPRRLTLVGAVGLLVVIVTVAAVTAALTYRVQVAAQNETVLSVDPDARWPVTLGPRGERNRIFEEFHGLRVLTQMNTGSATAVDVCLSLVRDDALDNGSSYRGFYIGACGAGEFPAVVSMKVTEAAPGELRERYADGTSLQFVLRDDVVEVSSRPPAPSAEPSSAIPFDSGSER